MSGRLALIAEVIERFDEAAAEEGLPVAVYRDPSGKRVVGRDQPAGVGQSIGRHVGGQRWQEGGSGWRHRLLRLGELPAVRACYDEGKRAAETLFMDYHRHNGVNVRIVRIFNTYGPRMHPFDGRVVSNFIRQAMAGEPITIFGAGNQTRSFCYRDDLVEAMIRMMNGPDEFVGPVNIGNPGEFTIRQLADLILELTGSRSQVVEKPLPVDDPERRRPDIALARERLGWEPRVPLREGLAKTIDWFRSVRLEEFRAPTPNY